MENQLEEALALLKQEKEDLARKEQEIYERAQKEEARREVTKHIEGIQKEDKEQRETASNFLSKLGEGWEISYVYKKEKAIKRKHYHRPYSLHTSLWDLDKDLLCVEEFERCTAVLSKGVYKVEVSAREKGRHPIKEYGMYLEGPGISTDYTRKMLKVAATVNKKIKEATEGVVAKSEREMRKKTSIQEAYSFFTEKYPDAIVKADTAWQPSFSKGPGEVINIINIELANGVKASYKIYPDGSKGRRSLEFPKTEEDLLDILNKLNFKRS